MMSGVVTHEWVRWQSGRWVYTSFDGGRTGMLSTETELLCGFEASGGMVLLDGRIARNGRVVGTRDEIIFTGERWT